MQNDKLLIGGIIGLAAGVAIGLMLAPSSGNDTRRNISETAGTWANSLRNRFRNLTGRDVNEDDPWKEHHRAAEGMTDAGYSS